MYGYTVVCLTRARLSAPLVRLLREDGDEQPDRGQLLRRDEGRGRAGPGTLGQQLGAALVHLVANVDQDLAVRGLEEDLRTCLTFAHK